MKIYSFENDVERASCELGRGDVAPVLAGLDDDLESTRAERFPYYSGTWKSPQKVRDKFPARPSLGILLIIQNTAGLACLTEGNK
jgi:hypothetical protein